MERVTIKRNNRGRMGTPTRRVLAIDAGSRRIKLLLAHSDFGRLRVVRQEMIDLRAEGLVAAEESNAHLMGVIGELGHPPLALAIPEHLSASQVVDVVPGPDGDIETQIGEEAGKLSGVSDSHILYDYAALESRNPARKQFWVAHAREEDVREQIFRLGIDQEDICDVTTSANALIHAYRMASGPDSAILVHMGAQTTVLAGIVGGQGIYASSFQMGGDFLTRALARALGLKEDAAESLKQEKNVLSGEELCSECIRAVDGWAEELRRQISEAARQNPSLGGGSNKVALIWSGSGFRQPGLLEYLASKDITLEPWPEEPAPEAVPCPPGFEIAFGTALQALGYSRQPVSLLPENYRAGWRERLGRQRLESASLLVVIICVLCLAVGTWRKLSLINTKEVLLRKVQSSQEAVDANAALSTELLTQYAGLRRLFASEQNTKDSLQTLAALQQTRTNGNLWYLVLADQQTYFSFPPSTVPRPAPPTNAPVLSIGEQLAEISRANALTNRFGITNVSLAKPGLIAELCVTGDADTVRQTLQRLVGDLKRQPSFSDVDLLSPDLRRDLADPKLVLPDKLFVLDLDFTVSEFQQPVVLPAKKKPATGRTIRSSAIAVQGGTP